MGEDFQRKLHLCVSQSGRRLVWVQTNDDVVGLSAQIWTEMR